MADTQPTPGETPAAEQIADTPAAGETPTPGTLPENNPEPAESETQDAPDAEQPDPLQPLKNALAKEREDHKAAAAEVKRLAAEVLELKTQNLIRHHALGDEQAEFIYTFKDFDQRALAAKSIDALRLGRPPVGKGVIALNANYGNDLKPKPPPDDLPMFKSKAYSTPPRRQKLKPKE